MTCDIFDASDNFVCSIHSQRELYALIRLLRALNRNADFMAAVVFYDEDGAPERHLFKEVLR